MLHPLTSLGRTPKPADLAAGYATDHIIVRFREAGAGPAPSPAALGLPQDARLMDTAFAAWQHRQATSTTPIRRHLLCRVPNDWTPHELVSALSTNPSVAYAEPDYIGQGGSVVPQDEDFDQQWYHLNSASTNAIPADIRSTYAWEITRGSTAVVVAVLDSGINTTTPEFQGRIVPGYDFVNDDTNPADDHGHGSMVSGVIGANANNTTLVAGVDWNCRLMPIKVLNAGNWGYYSDWADGIDWAVANGARVINLSAGGSSSDITLSNAIMSAISSGVIFVTITHNDSGGTVRFPGRMLSCITVGATDDDDQRSSFSNYGPAIDLCAPGRGIRSVNNSGSGANWNGTSFAAPLVAGVASLLVGLYPEITHETACALLCAGADDQVGDPSEDKAGFDNYHGWGRLNAEATLKLAAGRAANVSVSPQRAALDWSAPSNAGRKRPYVIEYASYLTGTWTRVDWPTNCVYSSTNVVWTDNGSETGSAPGTTAQRFYKVGVAGPR